MCIRDRYNNVKRQTEIVNEQVKTKISNLDDKVKQINETVKNQIEIQSREVENKYVETVEPVSYTHLDVYKRQGIMYVW